jgi:hypothetical protein
MKTVENLLLMAVAGGCQLFLLTAVGQNWTANNVPIGAWRSIASSADGVKLVAVDGGAYNSSRGPILTSTNSGITWFSNNVPSLAWNSVAISADGNRMVAIAQTGSDFNYRGLVFQSTNCGSAWTFLSNAPSTYFIASSADGTMLAAVYRDIVNNSRSIYTTTNSGNTWMENNVPNVSFIQVASSADGTKLYATAIDNVIPFSPYAYIYTSTNAGISWQKTGAPVMNQYVGGWNFIASSADGSELVAVAEHASVYISIDSGTTWAHTSAPSGYWYSAASSAHGINLIIVGLGAIYTSPDSGATWLSNSVPTQSWEAVASSADGGKLITGGYNTVLYTSQSTPALSLDIVSSNNGLTLSWVIPSMKFVLQQNSDIMTANWMDATNLPTLNLTNLKNEVILSPTNSSGFFRLKTP